MSTTQPFHALDLLKDNQLAFLRVVEAFVPKMAQETLQNPALDPILLPQYLAQQYPYLPIEWLDTVTQDLHYRLTYDQFQAKFQVSWQELDLTDQESFVLQADIVLWHAAQLLNHISTGRFFFDPSQTSTASAFLDKAKALPPDERPHSPIDVSLEAYADLVTEPDLIEHAHYWVAYALQTPLTIKQSPNDETLFQFGDPVVMETRLTSQGLSSPGQGDIVNFEALSSPTRDEAVPDPLTSSPITEHSTSHGTLVQERPGIPMSAPLSLDEVASVFNPQPTQASASDLETILLTRESSREFYSIVHDEEINELLLSDSLVEQREQRKTPEEAGEGLFSIGELIQAMQNAGLEHETKALLRLFPQATEDALTSNTFLNPHDFEFLAQQQCWDATTQHQILNALEALLTSDSKPRLTP